MKKNFAILAAAAGMLFLPVLSGCGPNGGTVTLINESIYPLENPSISMGAGNETVLNPGQWMRSSHDKNIGGISVKFTLTDGSNKVIVTGAKGKFGTGLLSSFWTSDPIAISNGQKINITVKNR